jgi:carbamoyltransferase
MRTLGINCLNHDAAMAIVEDGEILWAAHSERYSKIKNDHCLNWDIVNEAKTYGPWDRVVYYERPLLKKTRQACASQWSEVFSRSNMPQHYLNTFGITIDEYVGHHESHAAAGFFTSPFYDAMILTVDAIGEWDTTSIWQGKGNKLELCYKIKYPHSLGVLYSAFTQRLGLKPAEEEHILMGMAAYGEPRHVAEIYRDLVYRNEDFTLKKNLHRGLGNYLPEADPMDLAASIQKVMEQELEKLWRKTRQYIPLGQIGVSRYGNKRNLVYGGGVALNCVANTKLANLGLFDNIWIMPNPGDAGSSIGCIAAAERKHIHWCHPFLGHNIEGEYPVDELIKELEKTKIVGVANGRAEFGPRALGNRSLLADPRGNDMKDLVNRIKQRQEFRPFAPAILEEDLHEYFDVPKCVVNTPYMQFIAHCKHGKDFPAIVHHDGTSRVQSVNKTQNPGFYQLLKTWKAKTGCPMLLNTSLNIKGEPMVNDIKDAERFETKYNVRVL